MVSIKEEAASLLMTDVLWGREKSPAESHGRTALYLDHHVHAAVTLHLLCASLKVGTRDPGGSTSQWSAGSLPSARIGKRMLRTQGCGGGVLQAEGVAFA